MAWTDPYVAFVGDTIRASDYNNSVRGNLLHYRGMLTGSDMGESPQLHASRLYKILGRDCALGSGGATETTLIVPAGGIVKIREGTLAGADRGNLVTTVNQGARRHVYIGAGSAHSSVDGVNWQFITATRWNSGFPGSGQTVKFQAIVRRAREAGSPTADSRCWFRLRNYSNSTDTIGQTEVTAETDTNVYTSGNLTLTDGHIYVIEGLAWYGGVHTNIRFIGAWWLLE